MDNAQQLHNQSAEDRSAFMATLGFPLLVIAGGLLGYFAPAVVEPISGWTTWLLGIVMFGMGLTLKVSDFAEVVKRPLPVLIGVVAQFVIMPLIAVVPVSYTHLTLPTILLV